MKLPRSLLLFALVGSVCSFADAANFTGAIDSDWHKGGNWTGGNVPDTVSVFNALINPGKIVTVTQTTAFNGSFEIDNGSTVNIKNGATLTRNNDNQWWSRGNDVWVINITEGATLVNTAGNAHFGTGPNATGTVNLDNGTWNHFDQIKSSSTGNRMYINMTNGAAINAKNFWLRQDHDSNSAYLKGSGTITCTGTFRNDGRVEANGGDLVFASWSQLEDATRPLQMNDGNRAGWYARNAGKLSLPAITVSGSPVTWGDAVGDTTLEVINSVHLADWTGSDLNGEFTLDLVHESHPDAGGPVQSASGIWQGSGSDLNVSSISVTVCYDEEAVAASGGFDKDGGNVRVWEAIGGAWQQLTHYTVDDVNHRVTFTVSSLAGFALAESARSVGLLLVIR